ncbi:unnamed protein product [Moneuplotes crassus]|uniref:CS domain-containing protein n=1 Tax=Euplotes crassus TaxID=5936 RepID=A0AAD1UM99_EUPCR|nr:unnamed protein product [Moneuplotes crassus]
MVTPVFRIDQDDNMLYIIMIVKYAKISNAEFEILDNNFRFYLKPYSLNLTFSGKLKETGEENKSEYDIEKHQLKCQIEKMTKGEHFENLDMVTSLLSKMPAPREDLNEEEKQEILKTATDHNRPLVEVISSTNNDEEMEMEEVKGPVPTMEDMDFKLIKKYTYGFNNLYQEVFTHRQEELHEFAEIDPEKIPIEERLDKMHAMDKEKFDDERYVADTYEVNKEEVKEIIDQEHPYEVYLAVDELEDVTKRLENMTLNSEDQILTNKEIEECLKLRNREYLIDKSSPNLPMQCIEILYAYLYDFRANRFGDSCESPWTISKLSGALSYFVDYNGYKIADIMKICFRKALIYPLYRNFDLCRVVQQDLVNVLRIGKKLIVKIFLQIKSMNERRECGFLLNKIFINDFIVWIQQVNDVHIAHILKEIESLEVSKTDLDLGLEEIDKFVAEHVDYQ